MIEDCGLKQAYNNILQFISDCEIKMYLEKANCVPEGGRYSFTLKTPINPNLSWDVEIPPLPLRQVRYMGEEGQNIWNYPRLYVNGSSCVWCFALIKKEYLIEILENEIEECRSTIEDNQKLISELNE